MQALERARQQNKLRRVTQMTIPADGEQLLYASSYHHIICSDKPLRYVYFKPNPEIRAHVHGKTRKIEEKIFIHLIDIQLLYRL